jgi:peptidoglycan/LPS O-acetylase OafA/YrhL
MSGTVLSLPFVQHPALERSSEEETLMMVGIDEDGDSNNDNSISSSNVVKQSHKWALAVVKRHFRLAIPVALALIFASIVSGFTTVHEVAAQSTQSWWLYSFNCRLPSTLVGVLQQVIIGVWHGSCTLNNAIWTMKIELFGSFLVYLLVAIIRDMRSPRLAKRMLACLFVFMLVPSNTQHTTQTVRLEWIDESNSRSGGVGRNKSRAKIDDIVQRVKLNPSVHTALLEQLDVPLIVKQVPKETEKTTTESTNHNSVKNYDAVPKSKPQILDDNVPLVRQLLENDSDNVPQRQYTLHELQYSKSFGTDYNPWTWYSGFVSGTWIALDMVSMTTTSTRRSAGWTWTDVIEFLVAFLCSTFPYSSVWTEHHVVWQGMNMITDLMQVGSLNSMSFWHMIGASCLVHLVVRRRRLFQGFLCHSLALWLGQISFSLYLIHIPILYTVTCWWYNKLRVYNHAPWSQGGAALTALLLSLPVMILIASVFERYVDQPSIRISSIIGNQILGEGETHNRDSRRFRKL